MNSDISLKLRCEKAIENDWTFILKLLEETELTYWFTGKENFKNFFIVLDLDLNETVACFAIDINDNVGILKQFAVSKRLQGQGVGTYIANELVIKSAKELGLKRLYLQGGNKKPFTSLNFWRKTKFISIDKDEIEDIYAKNYILNIERSFPDDFFREATFYIDVK